MVTSSGFEQYEDALAEKVRNLSALNAAILRAEAAEAKVARVEEALAVLDEVAYAQIAIEKMLTILPTGPNRAQVPPHWQFDASNRARPFHEHLRAALDGAE